MPDVRPSKGAYSSFKVLMFMNISSLYMYVALMEGNMRNVL